MRYAIFSLVLFLLSSCAAQSHPGRTNAEGCHTDRKTGDYHCHIPKRPAALPSEARAAGAGMAPFSRPNEITHSDSLLQLDYEGFTVWLDCARRGAVKFRYNAKRYGQFFLDPQVPAACQQTSAQAYGHNYDRGHLVPANHLDASESAIKATNTLTNILPQAANMNRGAWLLTEEIIECYRDIDELLVIGGVIWGDNPNDDFFVKSHGVQTPDAFWKVIIRGASQDERAIAWIVPNSPEATKKNLDRYLVSVDELERIIGEKIPVADYAKHDKSAVSWLIPKGCNKG
jgi:endonuclease G